MKVVIIGSGNVATVFGRKISEAGHEIIQLVGRNQKRLAENASSLKTGYSTNILNISRLADIYIISLSDDAIGAALNGCKLNDKLVVHTAAAVLKNVLSPYSNLFGVIYPLQSLRRENPVVSAMPILVDGNSDEVRERLIAFSSTWADSVRVADDTERLKLHLAAVFANNFTNHLLALSEEFCRSNAIDFNYLYPLIEETIVRVKSISPSLLQTGPAIRNDVATLDKHRTLLENQPHLLELYNTLTNSIMDFGNRNSS